MNELETLAALGVELVARGHDWRAYLPPLRVLYRSTRDGTAPAWGAWNLEHGLSIAGMLGFGNAWPVHQSPVSGGRCPHCPPPETTGRPWERGVRDRGTLPDRAGYECLSCGFTWVELFGHRSDGPTRRLSTRLAA